jgi:copper chaperone
MPQEHTMKTRLAVPDINCSACETAIEGALAPIAGVAAVEVDIAGRVVDVLHDATVDAARLAEAVEDQGYAVAAHDTVG